MADPMLLSKAFLDDPYPTYRMLREEDPVHRSDEWGSWIVSRYDDVKSVLGDAATFSSSGRFVAMLQGLPESTREEVLEAYPLTSGLFQSDPPLYTQHRKMFSRAFSRHLADMPRVIEGIVNDAIDEAVSVGSMDVVADLAGPMPAEVVFRILGIPLDDRVRFKEWSSVIVSFFSSGVADGSHVDAFHSTVDEAMAWLSRQIADRRKEPRQDMLTELVTARSTGAAMTQRELLVTLIQFLVAGHETTTNLIANGMLSILLQPAAAARLRDDPGLLPRGIEEMLRFESPLQRLARRAARDVRMHDRLIKADDLVMVMVGSANRDPRQFDDPNAFDVLREPNRHLAFGVGHHFCMGASLARMEAAIAIDRLLARLPDVRLDGDVTWRGNVTFRGLTALRVRFG